MEKPKKYIKAFVREGGGGAGCEIEGQIRMTLQILLTLYLMLFVVIGLRPSSRGAAVAAESSPPEPIFGHAGSVKRPLYATDATPYTHRILSVIAIPNLEGRNAALVHAVFKEFLDENTLQ